MATIPQYRQDADARLKGWHVLLTMLAFFRVMFTANGIFLYSAITTFPGEDVEKSYLQGLQYNETIEARHRQAALGWTMQVGVLDMSGPVLRIEMADSAGAPLRALEVTATLRQPATTAKDMTVALKPVSGSPGGYETRLPALAPGQWDVEIEVRSAASDAVFTATKMVTVP